MPLSLVLTREAAGSFVASSTPFLTFTHILSVHDPYGPTGDFSGLFASSSGAGVIPAEDLLAVNATAAVPTQDTIDLYRLRYDQDIAETDAEIGIFLSRLSTQVLKNTAIIVTADHGEAFYEHGHLYHGVSLYQEEMHVPLFIYVPGLQARRIPTPVSLIDLAPTILDLEGVASPPQFKGISLLPMMEKSTWPTLRMLPMQNGYPFFINTKTITTHRDVPTTLESVGAATSTRAILKLSDAGVRFGSYVLMGKPGTSTVALYNIAQDPAEHRDLATQLYTPELFETYLTMLAVYRALTQ
jgi:arylsulfatase A-like enzyme